MQGNFVITEFMYPLNKNERIRFFDGLYFDNPRTKEEIDYVAKFLKEINFFGNTAFPDRYGVVSDDCITLMGLYDEFCLKNIEDENVKSYYAKTKDTKNIYKKLAKMWVIVRSELTIEESDKKYIIFEKDNIDTEKKIEKYNRIVSAMNNRERIKILFSFISFVLSGYTKNFLLDEESNDFHKMKNAFIYNIVMAYSNNEKYENFPYKPFPLLEKSIIELSNQIDKRCTDKTFLFICEKINRVFELYAKNVEMCLIELTSIIEMLITHNPDTSRFNVEDSISKQFRSKLLLLLYEENKDINKDYLEKELKFSYNIRSSIAHGNFENLEKELGKLLRMYKEKDDSDFLNSNEDALFHLTDSLSRWLKTILRVYIDDKEKIAIIKNM